METTIYSCPMTGDEVKAVAKLKDLLVSKKIEYDSKNFDDAYLVRFLRARKLDPSKAFEMFTAFLKWRKENNIDQIESFDFNELPTVKVYYPHGFHKVDKQGRPVYIEILGELKVDEMFNTTTPERLIKYQTKSYERLINHIFPACSAAAKNYVQQTFTILDLKKASSKMFSKKAYAFMKLTSTNSQNNYPEILGQMFVVNSGLMVKAAWSVIKAFIDDKTKKKIITCGSDYKKKLFEHVDPQNLPKFLGGECECQPNGCMYSNAGPWNKEGVAEGVPNAELIKLKANLESNTAEETAEEGEIVDVNIETEENEEERAKLDELSRQLGDQMNFSKEQTANAQYRLDNVNLDSDNTPMNTQENEDK